MYTHLYIYTFVCVMCVCVCVGVCAVKFPWFPQILTGVTVKCSFAHLKGIWWWVKICLVLFSILFRFKTKQKNASSIGKRFLSILSNQKCWSNAWDTVNICRINVINKWPKLWLFLHICKLRIGRKYVRC